MSQQPTAELTPAPAPPGNKGRTITAVICFVLAALLTVPAALAYWGQRTLTDTQRYIATVSPLIHDPRVQQAITKEVVQAIEKQVDVEALLNQALAKVVPDRPRLQALSGPIAAGVYSLVEREVGDFVASDAFASLWVQINTKAQQKLVSVMEGQNTGAIQIKGDQVVLDLGDVINLVKDRLVARGLTFLQNIPIPQVDTQIVLMDAPQLRQARAIYAAANPIAKWALPVVGVLYLLAFALALRRGRMAVAIGVAIAANAALMAFALSVGRQLWVDQLSGSVFAAASTVFFDQLLAYLVRGVGVFLWLGLAFVVLGWFAGRTRSAQVVRGGLAHGLERVGAAVSFPAIAPIGRWVAGNAGWLRVVSAGLGAVVLLWGNDVDPQRLAWSLVLIFVLLVVIQVLIGVGRKVAQTAPEPRPSVATGL